MKAATDLRLAIPIALLALVLAVCVAYLFSQYGINLYYFEWGATGITALLLFKSVPGNSAISTSRYSTWWRIISFQLALFVIAYGISSYLGPNTFATTLRYNLGHLGFAPWSMMLLIACIWRFASAQRQHSTTMGDILAKVLPISSDSQTWIYINIVTRACTITAISLSFTMIVLNIMNAITGALTPFSMQTILLSIIVILCAVLRRLSRAMTYIFQNTKQAYWSLPFFIVILALVLSVVAYWSQSLAQTLTRPPGVMVWIDNSYQHGRLAALFGQSWWFAWSVVGGLFIAYHSRRISTREMLLVGAILPLIITLLMYSHTVSSALSGHDLSVIAAIFGLMWLFRLLFQEDTLPCTIINYLPKDSATPKPHAYDLFIRTLIKACLMVLFFAIPMGSALPALFCSFMVFPFIIVSLFVCIVGLKTVFSK